MLVYKYGSEVLRGDRGTCPQCESRSALQVSPSNIESKRAYCHKCSESFPIQFDSEPQPTAQNFKQVDGPAITAIVHKTLERSDLAGYFADSKGFSGKTLKMLQNHPDIGFIPENWASELSPEEAETVKPKAWSINKFRAFNNTVAVFFRDETGELTTFQVVNQPYALSSQDNYQTFGGDNEMNKWNVVPSNQKCFTITFAGSSDEKDVFICEGVATAIAVWEMLDGRYDVICAQSTGGVRKAIAAMHTDNSKRLILAADNDWYQSQEYDENGKVVKVAGPKPDQSKNAGLELAAELTFGYNIDSVHPKNEWSTGGDWDDVRRLDDAKIKADAIKELRSLLTLTFDYGPYKAQRTETPMASLRKSIADKTAEAVKEIEESFEAMEWTAQEGVVRVIDAPPGSGKTQAILEKIISRAIDTGVKVEIWAHTHQQGEELKNRAAGILQDLDNRTLTVKRIKGMGPDSCIEPTVLEMLGAESEKENHKASIKTYCGICPLSKECPMKISESEAKKADIVVTTHSRGRYAYSGSDTEVNRIIYVDEDPREGLMPDTLFIKGEKQMKTPKGFPHLATPIEEMYEELFKLEPGIYTALDWTPSTKFKTTVEDLAEVNDAWQKAMAKLKNDMKGKPAAQFFAEMAKRKLSEHAPVPLGFWTKIVAGATFKHDVTHIILKSNISPKRHQGKAGFIISDANATREVYSAVFRNYNVKVWSELTTGLANGVTALQVTDISSKGDTQSFVMNSIKDEIDRTDVAVISTEAKLSTFDNALKTNFRRSLGTNALEDIHELYVIGWSRPPNYVITNLSFQLFGKDVEHDSWQLGKEELFGEEVNRLFPTNRLSQLVYNDVVRKPTLHAIQRQRLYLDKDYDRKMVLVGNYYVADYLTPVKGNDLGWVTNKNDSNEGEQNSKFRWGKMLADYIKNSETKEFKVKLKDISLALDAGINTVKKVGNTEAWVQLCEAQGLRSETRQGSDKRYSTLWLVAD